MKKFEAPTAEIIRFLGESVIVTSAGASDQEMSVSTYGSLQSDYGYGNGDRIV